MTTHAQATAPFNLVVLGASVAGLVVSAAIVLFMLNAEGHAAFNTNNDGISWGLPIATYVFFVLTSTGLTFVASLAMVFNLKGFYPVVKRPVWLAVATLLGGFACLGFELGHPFRSLWAILLSFQVTSPMNWMGVFYSLYLVLLLLKFHRMNAGDWDSGSSRKLGIAALVAVILAHGNLGAIFGMMAMRPVWYSAQSPLYFLATAFLSGVVAAVLITYLAHGFKQENMSQGLRNVMGDAMPKVFAASLGVVLLFVAARIYGGLWSNADGLQVFDAQLRSVWFWLELIALVGSFFVLLNRRLRVQANVQILTAAATLVALFIGRYEFVVGGQVVPLFKGNWVPGLIEYTPSLTEWMLMLLALSVSLVIYAVGEKMFDLGGAPRTSS
jgi:molybdopterin-containing oxidoreductase family membrane subunit